VWLDKLRRALGLTAVQTRIPDAERCEDEVNGGDGRCPERAVEWIANKRVCTEHADDIVRWADSAGESTE
jgi:hypothetical protein